MTTKSSHCNSGLQDGSVLQLLGTGTMNNSQEELLEVRGGSRGADTGVGWAIGAALAPLFTGRGGGARFRPASGAFGVCSVALLVDSGGAGSCF